MGKAVVDAALSLAPGFSQVGPVAQRPAEPF